MIGLGAHVKENFMSLEADFQREYGEDLAECLWGEHAWSMRKMYSLIINLGSEAITRYILQERQKESEKQDSGFTSKKHASADEAKAFFEMQAAKNKGIGL